jgi:hypothetical protein
MKLSPPHSIQRLRIVRNSNAHKIVRIAHRGQRRSASRRAAVAMHCFLRRRATATTATGSRSA